MGIYVLSAIIVLVGYELFKRYFPIKGVTYKNRVDGKDVVILDIRDYNEKDIPKDVTLQKPYAYLRRYHREIPDQSLHIVASNRTDLHLGARFLLRKGYRVSSFEIIS